MTLKTFVYTFALLLSSSILQPLHAQVKQKATPTDTLRTTSAPAATKSERFQGVQYASPEEAAAALAAQNDIPLFAGVAVVPTWPALPWLHSLPTGNTKLRHALIFADGTFRLSKWV